jgi:hypothetical protein
MRTLRKLLAVAPKTKQGDNVGMIVTMTAVRRADGMIEFTLDGPGAPKGPIVVPPENFGQVEVQMQNYRAANPEIETFANGLSRDGHATLSFDESERRSKFFALF